MFFGQMVRDNNYIGNQVICLAFTSVHTRSGRYGVPSESLSVFASPLGYNVISDSVTLSPVSVAAQGLVSVSEDKGLSLRFPRFIRVREDKSVEQASSTEFLAGMYREQQERGREAAGGADDGDLIDPAPSDAGADDDDWDN